MSGQDEEAKCVQRGYRVMRLYCYHCHQERPFSQVDTWQSAQVRVVRIVEGRAIISASKCPTPNIADDVRKIRAVCMHCLRGAMYVTTVERLEATKYSSELLCGCGLPLDHEEPHLDPPYDRRKRCLESRSPSSALQKAW